MAEAQNEMTSGANTKKAVEDLTPPPPPPPPPCLLYSPAAPVMQDSSSLPLPPPKESFSKFYQQRQVNELKRLYRHMHPELRKNLEEAVTEDLAEMLSPDDPTAQALATPDPVLPGEVQSMRWIFENWALDSIGERPAAKKLAEEEAIPSGDVKNRSMKFESQPTQGEKWLVSAKAEKEETKGDVHTARWLFETQPLDSLNKMYMDETELQEAILKEPAERGDVKGAAQLFETHSLDALGRCTSVEEENILQLKSEIQELKGGVKKTIKVFQTEPVCALQDKTGSVHEIKSICREEIQTNAVKTARWLFETQPLDTINKNPSKVQVIRGISLEEAVRGNVGATKWVFETQPLDAIKEFTVEEADFKASPDLIQGADVSKQCLLFETQPLDTLKGEVSDSPPAKEEVIKGDVKSTLWLFETQPMETLRDNLEIGHLKKVELAEDEKGAVKHAKHIFETYPLGNISKSPAEVLSSTNLQEVEKGDVKAFKSLFETLPLDCIRQVSTEEEEKDLISGGVKANQLLFDSAPLYVFKDSSGYFHKVMSVSRDEEVTDGSVKNFKWVFDTYPLDEFDESIQKVDVIRGITKQETMAGGVKTARWLFETQALNATHYRVNQTEQNISERREASQGRHGKTCRWLFETQPTQALCGNDETKQVREGSMPQGDVKSYTWMFETQPLDPLPGEEEYHLKVRKTFCQDDIQQVDVKTDRHLFEVEPLNSNVPGDCHSKKIIRSSSRVEIQSGEVSRVKEFFEANPLRSAAKSSPAMKETPAQGGGEIEPGAVHKFTWLFENCPMDALKSRTEGLSRASPEKDIQGGDVGGKKFIFETYSLDQIHKREKETPIQEETPGEANATSCTMLFETQPLYALQDKQGGYHEVTSVKKEEVMKGDVKGARWQFETKPLDQIKKEEEVFVIRAVTQEDFRKGDVQAARWRFETEPLDAIAGERRPALRSAGDVQKGDVQSSKQLFESEKLNQKKYVRTVSVSDVQQGDVRTSTWLFENQPMDSLKGDSERASSLTTVQREDVHKGDVKCCTWLFETQPMDSLKDKEAATDAEPLEMVPQADVKSTTWLFESTPLDKVSSLQHCRETEAKERTTADTLEVLFSHQLIQNSGLLIEASDAEQVKMATYQLSNQEAPQVQKEKIVGGNLPRILLQLLQRSNVEAWGMLVQEGENGGVKIHPVQLLDSEKSKEHLRDDLARTLQNLLNQDASIKKGIVVQETDTGTAKMIIYSLHQWVAQQHTFVKGDVKSTIGNFLASSQEQRTTATVRREDNEKGNVQLYRSCIEKGDLDYLKSLQRDSEIESLVSSQAKEEPQKATQVVKEPVQVQDRKARDVVLGADSWDEPTFLSKGSKGGLGREALHPNHQSLTLVQSLPPGLAKENASVGFPIQSVQRAQDGSHRAVGEKQIITRERKEGRITQEADRNVAGEIYSSGEKEINQRTPQDLTQVPGSDLHAAMQSLRRATAEAQTLQHQVQSKLQKMTENLPLSTSQPQGAAVQTAARQEGWEASRHQFTSNGTFSSMQKTAQVRTKVSQKNVPSFPVKVSDPEEGPFGALPLAGSQASQALARTDLSFKDSLYTAKPAKSYLNPFLESDYKEHSVPEEREQDVVIRGDVKTAIRALQDAATEQRQVEKEDVVRGNLKATLKSLEKSNVNVSQGDFKAAMIYRNAGQPYSMSKRKQEPERVRDETMTVSPSGSQGVNDFSSPPASLMRTEGHQLSPQPRDAEVVCCPPSAPPPVPKSSSPAAAQASPPRLLEKPQFPPKSDATAPPRKKPALPPKPEFLLKEAPPSPARCSKEQPRKALYPPSLSKFPTLTELNQPNSLLALNQARASGGTEIWEPPVCQKVLAGSPGSPIPGAANAENIGMEKKAMKDPIGMPLQNEEEKYKASKEEKAGVEAVDHSPSPDGHEGGNCQLAKDLYGLPETQASLTSLGWPMDLLNPDPQRKPYLSAKGQANILKKGSAVTHVASLQSERMSLESQEETSEAAAAAVAASSPLEAKQVAQGHPFVDSRSRRGPETKNAWDAEKERPPVVMRERACLETDQERRKRLSVHKEEILKGNVPEAMEILENLRRQEALQEILTQVKELEEETSQVDVKALRDFFENVPDWLPLQYGTTHRTRQPKAEKAEPSREAKEDADSASSVELAFEDLERASAEIVRLKEQTLSRLLDIEEAIRKALYSISSLKSESDIAGLSGLFKESLGNSQSLPAGSDVRKIRIISSKARPERGSPNSPGEGAKEVAEKHQVPKLVLDIPPAIQPRASSPSSPSYISIQSAARKSAGSPQISSEPTGAAAQRETFSPNLFGSLLCKSRPDGCSLTFGEGESEAIQMKKEAGLIKQRHLSSPGHFPHPLSSHGDEGKDPAQGVASDKGTKTALSALSPSNPRRQKSILELQTSHDGSKLYGATRTVTEQYEEVDEFGNKIITSSTTVTKQSETSTTCNVVSCPTRYEVTASPILRQYLNSPANFPSEGGHPETGVVFVTFSNSKAGKK